MAKRNQGRVTRGQGWELISAAQREAQKAPRRLTSEKPEGQRIVLREEKRGEKVVTTARGFRLSEKDLKALAKRLKTACSAGGKVGDDELEVQGRHKDKLAELLGAAGYKVVV